MPVHDDRLLFEFLVLEGAQAGLSWETILKKRAAYRAAFDNFAIAAVAAYDEERRGATARGIPVSFATDSRSRLRSKTRARP